MIFCTFCNKPCQDGYKVVDVINNKAVSEYCLCNLCGNAYLKSLFTNQSQSSESKLAGKTIPINVINSAAELLALLLNKTDPLIPATQEKIQSSPCPKCRHTIADLRSKGRFGCPFCYKHFDNMIINLVDIAQKGARKHVGKVPKNFVNTPQNVGEEIKTLKLRLISAIEHEHFEDAAKLRDQLKKLDS